MMAIAWTMGTFSCVLGLGLSYKFDLPTGPLVVCTFGSVLLLTWAIKRLVRRPTAT